MTASLPRLVSKDDILAAVRNGIGIITLNRPRAMNALTLAMIRDITALLLAWCEDRAVKGVFVRGASAEGKGVAMCAGGDIRFFHRAALAGDPRLDDFFTEEYTLDHLVHTYPKPYVAWMDGVVMGGGMGISQGAALRVVTERTRMAMPETNIGLFPDVGAGYFLSRCPGRVGEYLALTGQVIGAGDAIGWTLADGFIASNRLETFVAQIGAQRFDSDADWLRYARAYLEDAPPPQFAPEQARIDRHFAAPNLAAIFASLARDESRWARATLEAMRRRSPLMMAVTLEQIRRGRTMSFADNLRMERDLVRNCFALRPGAASETVEGIRALVIDKDASPRWNPATIEGVTDEMVRAHFVSPWPSYTHPLRALC
ncbi:MAG TPA: enoyl-CoA hydratase/isomerase family protein [Burkholderiales bacterium]|nr:enoyl-CoA hydratase/isomerase family protein [Burkholderiales bacterium]